MWDAIEGIGYTKALGERLKAADREMTEAKYEVFLAEFEMAALNNADVGIKTGEIVSHFSELQRRLKEYQRAVLNEYIERTVVDSGGDATFVVRAGHCCPLLSYSYLRASMGLMRLAFTAG